MYSLIEAWNRSPEVFTVEREYKDQPTCFGLFVIKKRDNPRMWRDHIQIANPKSSCVGYRGEYDTQGNGW